MPCPAVHVKGPQKTAGASCRRRSNACGRSAEGCRGITSPSMVMSCFRCDFSFCPIDTSGAVNILNQTLCLGITGFLCTSGPAPEECGVAVALNFPRKVRLLSHTS